MISYFKTKKYSNFCGQIFHDGYKNKTVVKPYFSELPIQKFNKPLTRLYPIQSTNPSSF